MGKTRQSANLVSDGIISVDIANDRVGIGTTNPQFSLDVTGDINLTGTLNQGGTTFVASRWTSGTGNDIYRLNGDVGIGTTNPQYKLDVVGDINFTGTFRQNGSQFVASRWTSGTGDDIYRLNGDVGIGTTNPLTKFDVIGNSFISTNLGIGTTNPRFALQVIGDMNITNGPVLIGSATSTGTSNQRLQVTGSSYISGNLGIGTTNPTSNLQIVGGDSRFGGVTETVSAATTYLSGTAMVLEMDVRQATTYTYTIPTGANIGIVSFRNVPAQTNRPSGTTVTLITTQNAAGTGNTTALTGIGTNCFVVGYENGATVSGISTRALVGSATTITLSTTANDRDFISFFINYTGSTNTVPSSYQIYVTKNGGFRLGNVGV